jgi:hypothetical protein
VDRVAFAASVQPATDPPPEPRAHFRRQPVAGSRRRSARDDAIAAQSTTFAASTSSGRVADHVDLRVGYVLSELGGRDQLVISVAADTAAASREARRTARPARARGSRLSLAGADCGEVGGHPDLVGDDHAARLKRLLPAQPELATANRPAHLDADTAASLRIGRDAMHRHLEPDRARLAVHRQVASDPVVALVDVLDRGRFEADRRVVLDVEEVGRAKMVVSARLVRVDRSRFDRSPHLRIVVVRRRLDHPPTVEIAEPYRVGVRVQRRWSTPA